MSFRYLKDFILNKRYLDKEKDRLKTYDELVASDEVRFSYVTISICFLTYC